MHTLQLLRCPACLSPHWPFRVSNHALMANLEQCISTQKEEKTCGNHPYLDTRHFHRYVHLPTPTLKIRTVLTYRSNSGCALLLSWPFQPQGFTFLSVCPGQYKTPPVVKAGRLGSCEGEPRGEEGRARKTCHWIHTEDICFVPFLITRIWQGSLPPPLTATAEA